MKRIFRCAMIYQVGVQVAKILSPPPQPPATQPLSKISLAKDLSTIVEGKIENRDGHRESYTKVIPPETLRDDRRRAVTLT